MFTVKTLWWLIFEGIQTFLLIISSWAFYWITVSSDLLFKEDSQDIFKFNKIITVLYFFSKEGILV